ncbi:MAG: hypothetical protein ACI8Y7_000290 [Candidatus Woesearchaeota archaeon]|jgi:hypothetical protein
MITCSEDGRPMHGQVYTIFLINQARGEYLLPSSKWTPPAQLLCNQHVTMPAQEMLSEPVGDLCYGLIGNGEVQQSAWGDFGKRSSQIYSSLVFVDKVNAQNWWPKTTSMLATDLAFREHVRDDWIREGFLNSWASIRDVSGNAANEVFSKRPKSTETYGCLCKKPVNPDYT